MFLELIGTFFAGLGVMGCFAALNALLGWISGRRFGAWIYPASVAAGMLGFNIWAEYSWEARQTASWDQLLVARTEAETSPLRPLSFFVTPVNQITAIDRTRVFVHPDQPDLVRATVIRMARWQPVNAVEMVFNCATSELALVLPDVGFSADGTLEGAVWQAMSEGDEVVRTACAAGEEIRNGRNATG
jgi:hypothetical protein